MPPVLSSLYAAPAPLPATLDSRGAQRCVLHWPASHRGIAAARLQHDPDREQSQPLERIMVLPTVGAYTLERAAIHESGHVAACVNFGLPIIAVTIKDNHPHMHRDRFRRERSAAVEALTIVCLSGPCAEELFFGAANDGSDQIDQQMARH
jgi:hypothetical protein